MDGAVTCRAFIRPCDDDTRPTYDNGFLLPELRSADKRNNALPKAILLLPWLGLKYILFFTPMDTIFTTHMSLISRTTEVAF